MTPSSSLIIGAPDWLHEVVDWRAQYPSDDDRMRLAIELARQNVLRGSGGPFGAAIFEANAGRVIAAGVNSVTRLGNSVLHAETLAIMLARARLGTYALGSAPEVSYVLVTSCEPCAMCLGATLWSGVRALVSGAAREDATAVGFDEVRYSPKAGATWSSGASAPHAACCARRPGPCSSSTVPPVERSTTADRPDISIRGTHGLSYTDAALAVDDMLFPAGEALRAVHAEEPRITLFAADRFHPSRAGTYLAALVVIGALTGRSTEGLSHAPPVVEI